MTPADRIRAAVTAHQITRTIDRAHRAADAVMRRDDAVSVEVCTDVAAYLDDTHPGDMPDLLPEPRFLVYFDDCPGEPFDMTVTASMTAVGMRRALESFIARLRRDSTPPPPPPRPGYLEIALDYIERANATKTGQGG